MLYLQMLRNPKKFLEASDFQNLIVLFLTIEDTSMVKFSWRSDK